ncbi:concanavalin A-like lectin/glucanase domain-containing protein [Gorgonomyces haynaldii]|nr:concanavalin A-like lectin/glucanase domain-containing protein [Gorgonomyces haynaldii]
MLFPTVLAQNPTVTGNCVSGRLDFDPLRIANNATGTLTSIDPSVYDFKVDYGTQFLRALPNSGIEVTLTKNAQGTYDGAGLTSTRYILYGRLTGRMKGIAVPGIVNAFITMSESKDEIDWEMVGGSSNEGQSNVFYKGLPEFGQHGGSHKMPSGTIEDGWHTYTIDWRSDYIAWYIDNQLVRTYKNDANAVSKTGLLKPGERWYPNTPSQIQIAFWDACKDKNGPCSWAGGQYPKSSPQTLKGSFDYIDIQCYDDKNNIVDKWPANTTPRKDASKTQSYAPIAGVVSSTIRSLPLLALVTLFL